MPPPPPPPPPPKSEHLPTPIYVTGQSSMYCKSFLFWDILDKRGLLHCKPPSPHVYRFTWMVEGYCKHEYTVALQQCTCISVQVVMKPIRHLFIQLTENKKIQTTTKKQTVYYYIVEGRLRLDWGALPLHRVSFSVLALLESGSLRQTKVLRTDGSGALFLRDRAAPAAWNQTHISDTGKEYNFVDLKLRLLIICYNALIKL